MQKRSKKLFVLIYTWLDRARRVDSECVGFIVFRSSFGSETLKILKVVQKVNNWSFSKKLIVSPLCTHSSFLKLFYSDSASQSAYCHVNLSDLRQPSTRDGQVRGFWAQVKSSHWNENSSQVKSWIIRKFFKSSQVQSLGFQVKSSKKMTIYSHLGTTYLKYMKVFIFLCFYPSS